METSMTIEYNDILGNFHRHKTQNVEAAEFIVAGVVRQSEMFGIPLSSMKLRMITEQKNYVQIGIIPAMNFDNIFDMIFHKN